MYSVVTTYALMLLNVRMVIYALCITISYCFFVAIKIFWSLC